jgi:hypothetical protein
MKKFALTALFFCAAGGLFAQEITGVIREISGMVEIKAPGSTAWVPARRGDVLRQDTVISTGLRSRALLSLGNSIVTVWPLSRITLAELTRASGRDDVLLSLRVGRIRAAVTPPKDGRASFTVLSPMATASVRGTVFDFDTVNLNVYEGQVDFSGASGAARMVPAGTRSFVNEADKTISPPVRAADQALSPTPPLGTGPESSAADGRASSFGAAAADTDPGTDTGPDTGPDTGGETPPPPGGGEGFTVDVTW